MTILSSTFIVLCTLFCPFVLADQATTDPQCYECVQAGFKKIVKNSFYPYLDFSKLVEMDDCIGMPQNGLEKCTSLCVEIIYASYEKGNDKSSYAVRGCYGKLVGNGFNMPSDLSVYENKTYAEKIENATFALRTCLPNPGGCNAKISISNDEIKDNTVSMTLNETDIKQCLTCPNDGYCEKPTYQDCAKKFCFSEIGYLHGVPYKRYGCTHVNPLLVSGNVTITNKDDFNPYYKDLTNVEHMYCEKDRCNSASVFGIVTSLSIVVISLLFR